MKKILSLIGVVSLFTASTQLVVSCEIFNSVNNETETDAETAKLEVELEKEKVSLKKGSSAEVRISNYNDLKELVFTSADSSIATVELDDSRGLVTITAINPGDTTINVSGKNVIETKIDVSSLDYKYEFAYYDETEYRIPLYSEYYNMRIYEVENIKNLEVVSSDPSIVDFKIKEESETLIVNFHALKIGKSTLSFNADETKELKIEVEVLNMIELETNKVEIFDLGNTATVRVLNYDIVGELSYEWGNNSNDKNNSLITIEKDLIKIKSRGYGCGWSHVKAKNSGSSERLSFDIYSTEVLIDFDASKTHEYKLDEINTDFKITNAKYLKSLTVVNNNVTFPPPEIDHYTGVIRVKAQRIGLHNFDIYAQTANGRTNVINFKIRVAAHIEIDETEFEVNLNDSVELPIKNHAKFEAFHGRILVDFRSNGSNLEEIYSYRRLEIRGLKVGVWKIYLYHLFALESVEITINVV